MFYIDKKRLFGSNDVLLLQVVPAIAVFILVLAVTFLSWTTAKATLKSELSKMVIAKNNDAASFVLRRMNTYENILRGGKGLLVANPSTTRAEWKVFLDEYDIQNRYPGVLGIGYTKVLTSSQLQSHIDTVKAEGFPDYKVFPENERNFYTAITYIEPFTGTNLLAHGYDMYTDPVRKKAMDEARDTGKVATTDVTTLIQDKDQDNMLSGFLLYIPVYDVSKPLNTIEDRRAAITGYVYAPFRINDLIESAYGNVVLKKDEAYGFVLRNPQTTNSENMYESPRYKEIMQQAGVVTHKTTITLPSGTWEVEGAVTNEIVNANLASRPAMILVGGILFSCITAAFTYLLLSYRSRLLAEKEEQHLQAAKDELLALASHQLRTPATGVKQYVGMVREGFAGKISSMQKQLLDKAYESNERQLSTINEMLFVARADAGFLKLDQSTLELSEMIRDIADEQISAIRNKQQKLTVTLPKNKVTLHGDPQYLRMTIENLLSNATKYTKEHGTITISLRERRNSIILSVADTGLGVAQKDQHLLFQKFSRIPNELTNKVSGSGIGLYLCKQVVEAHNGTISFESTPNVGSTVTIVLPKHTTSKTTTKKRQ